MTKAQLPESNVLTMPLAESSSATSQTNHDVTDGDSARRAYERFLERGAEHGHDLDDWLEAERELRPSPTA